MYSMKLANKIVESSLLQLNPYSTIYLTVNVIWFSMHSHEWYVSLNAQPSESHLHGVTLQFSLCTIH